VRSTAPFTGLGAQAPGDEQNLYHDRKAPVGASVGTRSATPCVTVAYSWIRPRSRNQPWRRPGRQRGQVEHAAVAVMVEGDRGRDGLAGEPRYQDVQRARVGAAEQAGGPAEL
jgi:hypothetical protein